MAKSRPGKNQSERSDLPQDYLTPYNKYVLLNWREVRTRELLVDHFFTGLQTEPQARFINLQ